MRGRGIKGIKSKVRRLKRVRAKILGRARRPRLSVFRSLRYIYAQIIDDPLGKTLVAASERELTSRKSPEGNKIERARKLGELLAKKALAKKIKMVTFDRGGYRYHGRVKALAEGAREAGLSF